MVPSVIYEIEDLILKASRLLCAQMIAAGLLLMACTDSDTRMVVDPYLETMDVETIMFGFSTIMTRDGVREFYIEADTALKFRDSTVVHLRGNVKLTAFNEDVGTEKAIVTSDRGRLDNETNEMWGEGNSVLLIRTDGRRIESYELRYTPDTNSIRSDSSVVMHDGDDVVEGTSFTSDLDFEDLRIENARTRGGAVRF